MSKTKEMESFLNDLSFKLFGRSRNDNVCVVCGSNKVKPEDFVDEISRQEYKLSHMCQECQDATFAE